MGVKIKLTEDLNNSMDIKKHHHINTISFNYIIDQHHYFITSPFNSQATLSQV